VRPAVIVRAYTPADHAEAVGVLARGMRDNPQHLAAFGDDPERRRRCLARLFDAMLRVTPQQPHCAIADGVMVGVIGALPPGRCQPSMRERLRLFPAVAALGPSAARRVVSWTGRWADADIEEPHVHLGPVAVDLHLQGRGIGSRMMEAHCADVDAQGATAYLETDRPENVRFYERSGYEVIGEADVIGVHNWYMRRPPAASSATTM
jgi:ribosomal protein S18 acetylase RimI-like enzyme